MSTVAAAEVQVCENFIGYKFKDPALLQEALQPASNPVRYNLRPHHDEGYRRLPDVARKLRSFLTSKMWFEEGKMMPDLDPSKFDDSTSEMAEGDEFMEFIVEMQGNDRSTDKSIVETQQAIFAAAWCDGGFEAYITVLENTLKAAQAAVGMFED
ncbi:MAG: hypothetical protein Q9171_004813 [Xanthocarpia ochracea]